MSTSATDARRRAAKTALGYLVITILCAAFGAVYELYSYEVYSFYMLYAFAVPLLGGVLPYLIRSIRGTYPAIVTRMTGHAAVATLTVGCIVAGVLEIYGTSNALVQGYWYVGISLGIVYIALLVWGKKEAYC